MGVMGAIGRGFERNARRRHARRLEIIHAKSEARAIARGYPLPTGAVPVQQPYGAPEESLEARLQRLFDAQDAVTHRWLEYELDVAKVISYPAMSDGRQPLTAAFLRAKKVADGLRPSSAKAKITKEQFDEYRNAVTDYEVAFDVAERDARRIQDSNFTSDERKRLDTAKQLLSVAVDQAATPAERQIAYKRVREELDGLISLSDGAIDRLEKQVSLELTTGPSAVRPDPMMTAAAPSAPPPAQAPPAAQPQQSAPQSQSMPAPWPVPSRSAKRPETR
ncbi:hypothetical protein QSV35_02060 [Microbacterium sp. ASV49]|uniref:Uncharacterized protein n=2 Tax=Microbacterium candidum TaxID=3041922 RepID=A0ABT7MUJ2_9MICO|nr:hypothetical protein [Microbacterium sp. ASV49]MDL9978105.1 hypothetical protein [Microbacterium sp. ASV49]